jgi:hypothetical protein
MFEALDDLRLMSSRARYLSAAGAVLNGFARDRGARLSDLLPRIVMRRTRARAAK